MVRKKMTLSRQAHGVNAVWFDGTHGDVAHRRDDHERNQQLITAGEFSNEENPGEGRVKDGTHHRRHAIKARIRGGHGQTEGLYLVPQAGKHIAGEASEENGGSKRTTAASSARSCRGSENFHQRNQGDKQQQVVVVSVENGVVEHGSRFGCAFVADQDAHYVVTFAVEWRKEEDEQRQHGRSEGITRQVVFERGEHPFKSIHGAREIERRNAADQAQQNGARHTRNDERIVECHLKHGGSARKEVGYARRRGTRDEQGHK